MEIQHSMRDGCLVVAFVGGIGLFTAPRSSAPRSKTSESSPMR